MKRVFSLFFTITIMLGVAACSVNEAGNTQPEAPTNVMRDISTFELVKEMGYGINLGNTLEACGDWISGSLPSSINLCFNTFQ